MRFLVAASANGQRAPPLVARHPLRAPPGRAGPAAGRLLELETGMVLIGPADQPDRQRSPADVAVAAPTRPSTASSRSIDTLPERDRYLSRCPSAVQLSGLAERIGMAQSTQVVQTKMLDYFFSLRKLHTVAFQPIVELADRASCTSTSACSARRCRCCRSRSARSCRRRSTPTAASSSTSTSSRPRSSEIGRLEADGRKAGIEPRRYAINLTPFSLLDPRVRGRRRWPPRSAAPASSPRQITIECTEQQSVPDIGPLQRQVKALRKARLRVRGRRRRRRLRELRAHRRAAAVGHQDRPRDRPRASATTTPSRRWSRRSCRSAAGSARTSLAEGIERRADLAALTALGVEFGQGYLLGQPAFTPMEPRRLDRVGRAAEAKRKTRASVARLARQGADPTDPGPRRARVPSRA